MTNPFKKIAAALLLRGGVFSVLGLVLLARAVPSLLDLELSLNVSGALIGAALLGFGVTDIVHGVQQLTRMRKDKLDTPAIDQAYNRGSGGSALPERLMNADENPNEAGQARLIDWLARIFPRLAYLPHPYTGALHAVLVAFSFGVAGLVLYVLLRIVMAGPTDQQQLGNILDWYLWLYFLIGFAFWAAVSRYGFRRALRFESRLMPGRMVTAFLFLLLGAVVLAVAMGKTGTEAAAPPDLGLLIPILWGGSLLVVAATGAIAYLRSRRAPDHYAVHRGEEFFTVGMHPTDMINVIKSYTGRLGAGAYMHLGSWKPDFKEHTAVQAGEFEANLDAESGIQLNDDVPASLEARVGTVLAWAGILTITLAGVLLWQAAGTSWDSTLDAAVSLRTPAALSIFGFLLYRLGIIPTAELRWTSVITSCRIDGTFQTQGGMALMNSGQHTLKGSVLTSATVQPKCAYLTSVGFLRPGLGRNKVVRLIDRVEPAAQIAGDLLAAIRHQATQMMHAGAPLAAAASAQPALPEPAADAPVADDADLQAGDTA
ncbi:MAG TPA: hypothetical protein VFE85_05680 [Woeseiaceae bacterium]|nr:hypothetical protein [Woeseiaceae bacterium]